MPECMPLQSCSPLTFLCRSTQTRMPGEVAESPATQHHLWPLPRQHKMPLLPSPCTSTPHSPILQLHLNQCPTKLIPPAAIRRIKKQIMWDIWWWNMYFTIYSKNTYTTMSPHSSWEDFYCALDKWMSRGMIYMRYDYSCNISAHSADFASHLQLESPRGRGLSSQLLCP